MLVGRSGGVEVLSGAAPRLRSLHVRVLHLLWVHLFFRLLHYVVELLLRLLLI